MSKWIKNSSGGTKTWVGQQVTNTSYYKIDSTEEIDWANDSVLLVDIANGDAIVAKDDSGNENIIDVNDAIDYLKGHLPIQVISESNIQDALSKGNAYIVHSYSMGTTSTTKKIHLAIKNNHTSKSMIIKKIVISTTEDGLILITKDPQMTSGTTLTPINTNFPSSNTSDELTYKDPVGTNGTELEHQEILARTPYEVKYADAICLGNGDKLGIGFKGAAGSKDIHISIHFYYKD